MLRSVNACSGRLLWGPVPPQCKPPQAFDAVPPKVQPLVCSSHTAIHQASVYTTHLCSQPACQEVCCE